MQQNNRLSSRSRLLLVILALTGLAVIGFTVLSNPRYTPVNLYQTPYRKANLTKLQGQGLYSYNGMGFYRQDIKNGSVKVLAEGVMLPTIENIYWGGDKGVLLNFTDGGLTGSLLEKELSVMGRQWDEVTDDFIWYFEFSSGTLRLVSEDPIVSPDTYYSNDVFYYVRLGGADPGSKILNAMQLVGYSSSSYRESPALGSEEFVDIEYIGPCKLNVKMEICYIKRDNNNLKLYALQDKKAVEIKLGSYDRLIPAGNGTAFIGIKGKKGEAANQADSDVLKGEVYIIDIGNKREYKTGNKINMTSTLAANSTSKNAFYLLEPSMIANGESDQFLSVSKNLFGNFKSKQLTFKNRGGKEPLSRGIAGNFSSNDLGMILYQDGQEKMIITVPKGQTYKTKQLPLSAVQQQLASCLSQYTKYNDYTAELKEFRIGVIFDSSYQANVQAFSKCANQKTSGELVGYSFSFVGLSPTNGRFVTD